ncbi:oxytocin receptor [Pipistrellus kuhlii]|uniref:Oxytocin receptor n=1 Tax=Pipistrellus kuhlii TaxID=59472 RepID=A0A7J7WE47_PIPKU|nr:oxytocin receptor [Pipistrellus kuhlii]KAF6335591.1 oxytocin receptor [Pipistrellus kuhlii]
MEGALEANWSAEAVNGSAAPPGPQGNRTLGPLRNEALARVEVAVLCLILFLALSGNACVLLALRTTRHKHSRLFFFMKHLSIADLVVAVFQVLPQLLWDITFRFHGPDLLCRLVKYLQVVGMFASTYLLLLMSLDRCLAICQPLRTLRRRADRLAVLLTWLGCLVASAPQVHIFSIREVADGVFDCWAGFIQPWGPKAYVTWITLAVYIVPVIVLTACYSLICFKIWQNFRNKTAAEGAAKGPECAKAGSREGAALARVSSVKLISRAKIRTVKMTFIIVLAFIVCWTPFFFVQMWSVWDANAPKEASAFIIAMLLASLNSCCNPWIYMLFTGHLFHELMQRVLCCSSGFRRGSRPGDTSVSKKSNSSTFVLSRHSSSQRSSSQLSSL